MLDPKRLESPENLKDREYWKDRFIRKETVKPEDILEAALNIYQSEWGARIDDDDAMDETWKMASDSYVKHCNEAKDNDELVTLIVRDLHGDSPTIEEVVTKTDAPKQGLN